MPAGGTPSASSDPADRVVPEALRGRLAKTYGPVLAGAEAEAKVRSLRRFASCGDRVTADAIRWGNLPLVGIVDLKTERAEKYRPSDFAALAARRTRRVVNPAGVLTHDLRAAVRETIAAGGGLIEVDGEEDLGALALVESLEIGATVIYGIPGAGVSFVTVDVGAKNRVHELIAAMVPRGR